MPLPGVNHEHTGSTRGSKHICTRFDCGLETGNIVAERGTKPAGLQKIPLHIDDE